MTAIRAAQLIYTRVEPPYSPIRKPGFQTVYKTTTLSSEDVTAIEKRIQCFKTTTQNNIHRLQFFALNTAKYVIAYSTPVVSHPVIVDKDRRTGVFLAHCLVLDRVDLQKIDNNPFTVFDVVRFLETPEDMITELGQASGIAPALDIEVRPILNVSTTGWTGEDTRRLIAMALRAEELAKQMRSVLFYGEQEAIHEALRVIFFLTPRHKRPLLSFDTFIERCAVPAGLYWAVGASERQGGTYVEVNASQRKVAGQMEDLPTVQDPYLAWLRYVTSPGGLPNLTHARTIQLVVEALDRHTALPVDELDDEACTEYWNLNIDRIGQELESLVSQALGKRSGSLLAQYLRSEYKPVVLLNVIACQSLASLNFANVTTEWLLSQHPELHESDWKSIQSLARRQKDLPLLYLASALSQTIDVKSRDEALDQMTTSEYRQLLRHLMNPIEPANLVTPKHVQLLVEDGRLTGMRGGQMVELVEALVRKNSVRHLGPLASMVSVLGQDSLTKVEKLIRNRKDISPVFIAAVRRQREALGQSPKRFKLF